MCHRGDFYTLLPVCKLAKSLWKATWNDLEKWTCTSYDPVLRLFTNVPVVLSFQAHSRMACPRAFEVTQVHVTCFGHCNVNRRNRCHFQVEVPRASKRITKLLSPHHGDHGGIRNGATISPSWSANEKRLLQTHTGYTAWGRNKLSPLRCLGCLSLARPSPSRLMCPTRSLIGIFSREPSTRVIIQECS